MALIGGAVALASEGLPQKVLDALFGAEEEFEYTASTTPEPSSTSEPVGAAWRTPSSFGKGAREAPLLRLGSDGPGSAPFGRRAI